jgi:hypothetical protein
MATERMEVTDWRDSPPPIIPPANARSRFLSPTLVGVLGTLLLHAMFIQTVVLGGHGLKPKRPEIPESSSTLSKSADTETELVVLSLPATTSSNQVIQESALSMLSDLSKVKIKAPIDVVPPESLDLETLALSEDLPSNQGAGAAAGTEQARLFGIYTGQIQARIDRVWRRPRTPVNENLVQFRAFLDS